MPAKFQDYYHSLGVARGATQDEIQGAYRTLARKYHPDMNKEPSAEAKFKEIGEAYEVLKDPEKRKKYDALGANWKQGQEFRPPPGWTGARPGGTRVDFGGGGRGGASQSDFSDFFESIFGGVGGGGGGMGGGGGGFANDDFAEAMRAGRAGGGGRGRRTPARAGQTHEVEITISLADAFHGATRHISLSATDAEGEESSKSYDVRIPAGVTNGSTIRLSGQGGEGHAGGPSGDLLLKVNIAPDARFRIDPDHKHTLIAALPIAAWEAALGAKVHLETLDGAITISVPPGSQSGQKLRIKGKGLPIKGDARGDLYAELRIVVPKSLTDEERKAWEHVRDSSALDARQG